jgi:REP element-mobilizing transposase RayT
LFEDKPLRGLAERIWASLPSRFPSVSLDAFVVMPNHVHMIVHLVAPQAGASPAPTLGRVIGAFKSVVAVEWQRVVQRERPDEPAAVWQRNYYEHIVRNEEELHRIREYIANNPAMWQFDRENSSRTVDAGYERAWSWIEQS